MLIVMVMLILIAAIIGLALYINLARAQNREQAKIKAYSLFNQGQDQKAVFQQLAKDIKNNRPLLNIRFNRSDAGQNKAFAKKVCDFSKAEAVKSAEGKDRETWSEAIGLWNEFGCHQVP